MKKILFIIFLFFIGINVSFAYENVNIYVFTGDGCKHCNEAIEYLYNHMEKYSDIMDVKIYEVWNNQDNSKLYNDLKNNSSLDIKTVPCIVIGDSYTLNGYTSLDGKKILNEAYTQSRSGNYHDIVKEYLVNHPNVKEKSMYEHLVHEKVLKDSGIGDYVILGLFLLILVLSIYFIFCKKKTKNKS